MFTIKMELDYEDYARFKTYLKTMTWAGAEDRVQDMGYEETQALLQFLDDIGFEGTDTDLNDLIWFDWDDIYEEMNKSEEE